MVQPLRLAHLVESVTAMDGIWPSGSLFTIKALSNMNTFSFRADTIHHVFELMLSPGMGAVHRLTVLPDQFFPDVEVELVTETSADDLARLVAAIDDAHVIADTLRPCDLKSNPLQRGEDLDPLPPLPEF